MTKPSRQQQARMTMFSERAKRNPAHATTTVECKLCRQEKTAYAFLCPDPSDHAQHLADLNAMSWLQSHPCQASIYAHPKSNRSAA